MTALQPQPAAPVEHPIIFSGPMVRAILAGTKTQTRRVLRLPAAVGNAHRCNVVVAGSDALICTGEHPRADGCEVDHTVKGRYGKPGDRLWVRETWAAGACSEGLPPSCLSPSFYKGPRSDNGGLWFRADGAEPAHPVTLRGKWRPAIHMVRWASRITLEVTDLRVQRLHAITEEDARAEGVEKGNDHRVYPSKQAAWATTYRRGFETLWDSINGDRDRADWAANPHVWVVSFRRAP